MSCGHRWHGRRTSVARLFHHTEQCCAATLERIEDACRENDASLDSPQVRAQFGDHFIPDPDQLDR